MRSRSSTRVLFYLLLFICACLMACKGAHKKQAPESKAPLPVAVQQMESDTVTIEGAAAIFYTPDSTRLDSLFVVNGEADMRTGADDYLFYLNESATFLEPHLPLKEVSSRNIIKFVAAGNKVSYLRLDTLVEYWGVILFDPAKAPRQVDITAIEEEYKAYFQ